MGLIKATTVKVGSEATSGAVSLTLHDSDQLAGHNGRVAFIPDTARGNVVTQAKESVDVTDVVIAGSVLTGTIAANVSGRKIAVGDIAIAPPLPGFVVYVATFADLVAAVALVALAGRGEIYVQPATPIQATASTLVIPPTISDLTIWWPPSSPLLAPAGSGAAGLPDDPYELIKIGGYTSSTQSNVAVNIAAGARFGTVVSSAGFAKWDFVLMGDNLGYVQVNRILNIAGNTLYFERPVSKALTTANASGVTRITGTATNIKIVGLHIDNNGNTNPGLKAGWTSLQHTTATAAFAAGDTNIQVASSAGFAAADVVYINDGATKFDQALGYVVAIDSVPDATHLNFVANAIPVAFANGTKFDKVGTTTVVGSQMPNVGLSVLAVDRLVLEDFNAKYVTGSGLATYYCYEPVYRNVTADRCGYPYLWPSKTTGLSACPAIWHYAEIGGRYDDLSRGSHSWGWQASLLVQAKGRGEATGSRSRNTKVSLGYDCDMDLIAMDGYATGVAIELSRGNTFRIRTEGNVGNGFQTFNDTFTNDNTFIVFARNNNGGAAEQGDVYIPPLDIRNRLTVLNDDAVIVDQAGAHGIQYNLTLGATVGNTVTETTLLNTGKGTLTIPANKLRIGDTIRIRASGYISNTGTPNVRLRFKLTKAGPTVVIPLDTTALATPGPGSLSTSLWWLEASLTCRALVATNTIEAKGLVTLVAGTAPTVLPMVTNALFNVDLTADQVIDLTVEWGTADPANTITSTKCDIQLIERIG